MHTKKEKELIENAWRGLLYRCECSGNQYHLEQAYKRVRKDRKSAFTAKALILREVRDFWENNPSVKGITDICKDILSATLTGLNALQRTENYSGWMPQSIPELMELIEQASKGHAEAIERQVELNLKRITEEGK